MDHLQLEIRQLSPNVHQLLFVKAHPFLSCEAGVCSVLSRPCDAMVERFMESSVTPTDQGFQGLLATMDVRKVRKAQEEMLTHIHVEPGRGTSL
jgi:hypothetical protein